MIYLFKLWRIFFYFIKGLMNAIIIEDEKLVAKELSMKITKIDPSIKIVQVLRSVKSALRWFTENTEPDVVFADIQLSDGISFEIFDKMPLNCSIIFITSFNEYAIRAFKVNGIDYLLKPVEPKELEKAIEKVKKINKVNAKPAFDITDLVEIFKNNESQKSIYKKTFLCNYLNAWVPVKTDEIAYFVFDVVIYGMTTKKEKYMIDSISMDEVEEMLNPDKFFRVNRQFIVNKTCVLKLWGIENYKMKVKLKDPHQAIEIDMSRHKSPIFKKWLEK
jgi:two-component system, LytTR family, response regulator LytT